MWSGSGMRGKKTTLGNGKSGTMSGSFMPTPGTAGSGRRARAYATSPRGRPRRRVIEHEIRAPPARAADEVVVRRGRGIVVQRSCPELRGADPAVLHQSLE